MKKDFSNIHDKVQILIKISAIIIYEHFIMKIKWLFKTPYYTACVNHLGQQKKNNIVTNKKKILTVLCTIILFNDFKYSFLDMLISCTVRDWFCDTYLKS